jgi:hypothetical protein
MKNVGAVILGSLVSVFIFSQVALAGTSVYVGLSSPGMYFEVSSVRPSPHHVWVEGCRQWNGYHRVWVPGHWRYAPAARTVYVPVRYDHPGGWHRDYHRDLDRDGERRGDQHGRDDRNVRYGGHDGQNGYRDRDSTGRD